MVEVKPIPIESWGRDHWSLLGYIETRCVDYDGVLDNRHLRCNARLHAEYVGIKPFGEIQDGADYGTRIASGIVVENHDDWSCICDMVDAKLLKIRTRYRKGHRLDFFGSREATIKLTDYGSKVAAALRQHKANGGAFMTFSWPVWPTTEGG